jgi:hypothetical protein
MRELGLFLDRLQEEERTSASPSVVLIAMYYKLTAEEVEDPSLHKKHQFIADGWIEQVGKCFIRLHCAHGPS